MDGNVRLLLLWFLGAITATAVVGAILLVLADKEIPPVIGAIIGGGMAAMTTLLTPPRPPKQGSA